jgi:Zn-dependent protease
MPLTVRRTTDTGGQACPRTLTPMTSPAAAVSGWRIGTLAGVPVMLSRSWVLVAVAVTALFGPVVTRIVPELGAGGYAVAAVFAVLLLFSVLAHEAAHAVVAKLLGFTVHRIVADFWGGHTAYHGEQHRPGPAALVAVAGPVANLALALAGWSVLQGLDRGVPWLLLTGFASANAFVGLFNLLPGLPLDGGFLMEAVVWKATGRRSSGTIVAGWVGRALVLGLVCWAVVLPAVSGRGLDLWRVAWVGLIGLFLWAGATRAVRAGTSRRRFERTSVQSVWRRAGTVGAEQPVDQLSWASAEVWVVTDRDGAPVAVVDEEAWRAVPPAGRAGTPVSAVALRQPPGWVVEAAGQDSVLEVVARMQALQSPVVAVRTPEGTVRGVVFARDL